MNPVIRAPQWSREGSIEISELPLEGVPDTSWLPDFPDFPGRASPVLAARAALAPYGGFTNATSSLPGNTFIWGPDFPDFPGRASPSVAARAGLTPFHGYTIALSTYAPPNLSWGPDFPSFPGRAAPSVAARAGLTPFHGYTLDLGGYAPPALSWGPTYPDFARRAAPTTTEFPFLAFPVPIIAPPSGSTRIIVIHTPDEVPIGAEHIYSVELDDGGVPVPFDVPPNLRVYHLNLAGVQVTDLPSGVMTQYGANPAYFRPWTPAAKGVYILEVLGLYLGQVVIGVQPVTVRPKFDPIGLAIDDVLVARNGDV